MKTRTKLQVAMAMGAMVGVPPLRGVLPPTVVTPMDRIRALWPAVGMDRRGVELVVLGSWFLVPGSDNQAPSTTNKEPAGV